MARYPKGTSTIGDSDVLDLINERHIINANTLKRRIGRHYFTCMKKLENMEARGILIGTNFNREKLTLKEWRLNENGIIQTGSIDNKRIS